MVSVCKCWKCCTFNIFEYETSALHFPPILFFSHTAHNSHSKTPDSRSESLDLLQMWSVQCMYWSLLLLQKSLEVWKLQCIHPCLESMLSCKAVYLHSFHHICVGNSGIHLTSASATQMDFISSCGQRPGRPNGGICCKGTSLRLVHRDLVSLKFQIDLRSGLHKFSNIVVASLKFWVTEMWHEANCLNEDPQIKDVSESSKTGPIG